MQNVWVYFRATCCILGYLVVYLLSCQCAVGRTCRWVSRDWRALMRSWLKSKVDYVDSSTNYDVTVIDRRRRRCILWVKAAPSLRHRHHHHRLLSMLCFLNKVQFLAWWFLSLQFRAVQWKDDGYWCSIRPWDQPGPGALFTTDIVQFETHTTFLWWRSITYYLIGMWPLCSKIYSVVVVAVAVAVAVVAVAVAVAVVAAVVSSVMNLLMCVGDIVEEDWLECDVIVV